MGRIVLPSEKFTHGKDFEAVSMTAAKWVPMDFVPPSDLRRWLLTQRAAGYKIVGVEQTANSVGLERYAFEERTILVLGHEREGMPTEIIEVEPLLFEGHGVAEFGCPYPPPPLLPLLSGGG